MINNLDLYEVKREDYASFNERFYSGKTIVKQEENDDTLFTIVYSKKTNKVLCVRASSKAGKEDEKYYIINYPDQDEWHEAIPKIKVELKTKEEVQMVLDFLKEHENDRTIFYNPAD